ncbi:restriction endonuclease [Streptomyces triticiradicis]|uniref:Restriction endonuclease n=1 Tax=Streptomyces triticiradicis TaxID=2651189 RepID=A0A7J5D7E6_9ACTN|nr:restriction endonuclease [Streptomyces triticiradicis]KAB1979455.1 restriction endonuclease [Streptomyces triticiradicis]
MPPRRTRRGLSCQSAIIRVIWAVLVPLAVLLQLVKHAPGVGVPLLLAASAAGGIYVVRRARKAEQRRLEDARQAQIREVQSREIARYHVLGPKEFEHAIAYLCQRDGCTNVEVSGGAGDLGADVVATSPDGRRIVIQCKRYGPSNKVGSPEMQRFGGTCYSVHRAEVPVVVTTSTFTRQAVGYAGAQRIRLYDERALAGWASQTGPAPWQVNQPAA